MLLAVDIGNSNIVFGIYHQNNWLHQWRLETSTSKTADMYAMDLGNFFLENNLLHHEISNLILSSVVPPLTPVLNSALRAFLSREAILMEASLYARLPIGIERPHEIGADLVANAVAAFEKYKENCIIVDFGTALTFTTVSSKGQILGVAIAPGLKTAMYSLFQNTAQLPEVPLEVPLSALGNSTTHALQAGVLLGYIGLVESLVNRIKSELNAPCKVIATGGLAHTIKALHTLFDEVNHYHTLEGLRIIAQKYAL